MTSTAFVGTNADYIVSSICLAMLGSIYLPCGKFDITALTVGFDMIFAYILLVRSAYRSPQANIDVLCP